MQYQGVLFDLDGVICHTDQYHYQAWKQIAGQLGVAFDQAFNNRLRGISRMESLELILASSPRSFSQEEKLGLADEKNRIYRDSLSRMTPGDLSPDVEHTLDTLRQRGYKLAIGSSSKNAGYILERLGLAGGFDAVVDGNHIQRSKPDPQVFLLAAAGLGLPPSRCLVVEDAFAGVQAAKAAGMDCAGIGDAARSPDVRFSLSALSDLLKIYR